MSYGHVECADSTQPPEDPRVYLAAERTLLAWVRTGLAMMGFGFVVARFGFFLRELAAVKQLAEPPRVGFSLWIGTALLLLGVVVNVAAVVVHARTVKRLDRGESLRFRPVSMSGVVALILAILGVGMAAYLVLGLGERGP